MFMDGMYILYYGDGNYDSIYSVRTSDYMNIVFALEYFLQDWYDYPSLLTIDKPGIDVIHDMVKTLVHHGFVIDCHRSSFKFKLEYCLETDNL